MKYESFFRELLAPMRARWMNDSDYEGFVRQVLEMESYKEIDRAIDQGVANGYSLEQMKDVLRLAFKVVDAAR